MHELVKSGGTISGHLFIIAPFQSVVMLKTRIEEKLLR